MSERPDEEQELEAFLSGESTLSRRYKQSGDEQPPAHVDAAILAASRWAIGADRKGADRKSADRNRVDQNGADLKSVDLKAADRTGADGERGERRHAGPLHDTGQHVRTRRRRSAVARWSVPLAMAAVVVVAVTLTVMIEHDPEIGRMEDHYDAPSLTEGEAAGDRVVAQAELGAPESPAPAAEPLSKSLSSPPAKPAPATSPAQRPALKEEAVPADQPASLVARQRSEAKRQASAVGESIKRDMPATQPEERVAARPAPVPVPAEPADDSIDSEMKAAAETRAADVGDAAMADLDQARDKPAFAGATTLPEPEQSLPSAVTAPDQQQAFAPEPAAPSAAEPGESVQPFESAVAEGVRDPQQWIEDIEQLLVQARRQEAIDSLEEFRREYPDYELPPDLASLLPAGSE